MSDKTQDEKCECFKHVRLSAQERLLEYGRTVKTCPKCNQLFYDTRVAELSVKGIQKDDTRLIRFAGLFLLAFGSVFLTIAILLQNYIPFNSHSIVYTIWFLIVLPLFFGTKRVITDLFTYKKRLRLLDEELLCSKQRCYDTEYMEAYYKLKNQKRL